jgi:hypothetical protein
MTSTVNAMGTLGPKMAYRIADTFLLRTTQRDGFKAELSGDVSWHTPWGSSVDLIKSRSIKIDMYDDAHVLLGLPGNLRIYLSATSTRDMILVLDAKDGEPKLPADLTFDSVASAFEKSTVAVFRRDVGGNTWTKLR